MRCGRREAQTSSFGVGEDEMFSGTSLRGDRRCGVVSPSADHAGVRQHDASQISRFTFIESAEFRLRGLSWQCDGISSERRIERRRLSERD
jgi:hypothetical protein